MAEKIQYNVDVNASDAKRGLQEFSRAAKKAGKDAADALDDTATAGDKARAAIKAMADQADTELRGAAKAADALSDALGPELTAKMDVDKVIDGLNRMGVSMDEIIADAPKFAATFKEIDDAEIRRAQEELDRLAQKAKEADAQRIDIPVDVDTTAAADGLERVRKEGDQSRSVLANLAGNATQDLGELGGVVGSLGVGIGQLAEYAVDGNIALGNLAATAGPLLAVGAGLAAVQKGLALDKQNTEKYQATVEGLTKALEEEGSAFLNVNQALIDNTDLLSAKGADDTIVTRLINQLPVLGGLLSGLFGDEEDAADKANKFFVALAAGGLTMADFTEALTNGGPAVDDFVNQLLALEDAGVLTHDQVYLVSRALRDNVDAYAAATDGAAAYEQVTDQTARSLEELFGVARRHDNPFEFITNGMLFFEQGSISASEAWSSMVQDLADGIVDLSTTPAFFNEFADQLHLTDDELRALIQTQLDASKSNRELQESTAAAGDEFAKSAPSVQEMADHVRDIAAAIGEMKDAKLEQITQRIHDLQMAALEFDDAAAAAESFAAGLDEINRSSEVAQSQRIIAASDAVDAFGQALQDAAANGVDFANTDFIPDTWEEVRNMPDDLKGVVDAFGQTRDQIQTELSDAFNIGGLPAFNQHLATIRQAVFDQLKAAGITGGQALIDALEALGLDDQSIQILMQVTGDEEAKHKIDTILGAVSDLPPSVVLAVTAIAETDPQGALQYLIDWFAGEGVTIPVGLQPDVDAAQWKKDAKKVADDAFGALHPEVIAKLQADVKAANKAIADTTVPREVKITPTIIAKTTAGDIDKIAKPRTAPVNVTDNGTATATNKQINYAARNRDTYVYVHTVPVGGGGGGGGGGATPVPDTAAAATMAATSTAAAPTATLSPTPMRVEVVNQTTAPAPINVTITSGVLGNHFDVERTVARALRRYQRVNGRR